jgi:hypothetical protein
MTWQRGTAVASNHADRVNRLRCDGTERYEGVGRDVQAIPCADEITGVQTAAEARARARAEGWRKTVVGDRCPRHRPS